MHEKKAGPLWWSGFRGCQEKGDKNGKEMLGCNFTQPAETEATGFKNESHLVKEKMEGKFSVR